MSAVETAAAAADDAGLKKPPTAYFLWLDTVRTKIQEEIGSKKAPLVSKAAGEKWKAMADKDKVSFVQEAEKLKKEYEAKIAAGAKKRSRKTAEEDESAKKPKAPRAPTAYWLWMADNRTRITEELGCKNPPQVAKKAGAEWATISASVKEEYQKKADEAAAKLKGVAAAEAGA